MKILCSYQNFKTMKIGTTRFAVHIDSDSENTYSPPKFQISEIHPYDDAEYTWATRDNRNILRVNFYRDGKLQDKMTLNSYEEDEYASYEEYVNDILESVAHELIDFNKDVEPVMVHY